MLKVNQIFHSFQGEGRFMGMPATFVRLYGCNLSCPWCDTEQKTADFKTMSEQEIYDEFQNELVVFTGGEPTLQMSAFILKDFQGVYKPHIYTIETNGTGPASLFWDLVSCSPKAAADYEIHNTIVSRIDHDVPTDLKYVVDKDFDIDCVYRIPKDVQNVRIYLQPEWNTYEESIQKAAKMVKEIPGAYLGIQAHKFWGVE